MRAEIHRQSQLGLTDEAFCASDVAFHRALVDGAGNPVLSYQLAGAVEAMQPLMNMITFTARSRERIVTLHARIADALEAQDAAAADSALNDLADYTLTLGRDVMLRHQSAKGNAPA
jgi:DNA-binding FadR family transcriptional regulator